MALAHSLELLPRAAVVNSSYICWHLPSQVGMRSFWHLRRMVFFTTAMMAEHQELCAVSGSEVELGSWQAAVLRSSVKVFQSVFQKFHLLTDLADTEFMVEEVSMMECRSCNFRKASSIQWWVVSSPMFANIS